MDKFSGPAIMVRFFIPLFLIICTMLPINFTTHSIISEKASGTMESVLLTPISTKQFLVGKILAFSIPVVLVTWVVQLIYIIFIILPLKDSGTFLSPMWLFVMFLSVPCMTIISVGIGTMISAKVNSVPVARQIGGLLIIPVMANAVSQVMISSFINHIWIQLSLLVFLIMCAVVVVLLNFSLFNREKIIEGWK